MEFLKHHYEKIILSLVLIGLVGAAGWLALQSLSVRSTIADINRKEPMPKPAPTENLTNIFVEALSEASTPYSFNFDGDHKIFNPEKILRNTFSGKLIPEGKIGPRNLDVLRIKPLRLRFRAAVKRIGSKTNLYLSYQSEFEYGASAGRWQNSRPSLDRRKGLQGRIAKYKRIAFTVTRFAGDLMDPASVEIDFDLEIEGGVPVPISLVGTNIWETEIEFEVDLFYPPESQNHVAVRTGYQMVFGGDTNQIIQITAGKVTLKASSNGKRTTLTIKNSNPQPVQGMNLNAGLAPNG